MKNEAFIMNLEGCHNNQNYLIPSNSNGDELSKTAHSISDTTNVTENLFIYDNFIYNFCKYTLLDPETIFSGIVSGKITHGLRNISDGDLVIIDKDKTPKPGSVAVYFCDGKYVLKHLGLVWDPDLWGVVIYVMKHT